MTVTGHVPQALNAFQGVEAGMDQINHLNYVSKMMRPPGAGRGRRWTSTRKPRRMRSDFSRTITPWSIRQPDGAKWRGIRNKSTWRSFEPGILKSPFVLDAKFRGMGGNTTADQMHERMAQSLAVIGALHRAGVTIVPGSDTGLVGYRIASRNRDLCRSRHDAARSDPIGHRSFRPGRWGSIRKPAPSSRASART